MIVLEIFKLHKLPGPILTLLKSASGCYLFISVFLQHAHYTYDDKWPFLLVNATRTTVEKQAKHDCTLCISEKLREMRTVFLSLTMGFISSQYGLTKAQTKHFVYSHPRARIHAHTHTHTQPDLSPQDVGTGWRSAVWGSRPAFPLGWHSAHINSTSLQKPLMQGRVLTVFWQWITICQPWPLFDCWSHWKTDLWQEQRLI